MELYEFGIGDYGACKGGHADAVAAGFFRVRRHRVEMADAAGGEHDIARVVMREVPRFIACRNACDFCAFGKKAFRRDAFMDRDGRRCAHSGNQRLHDGGPRHIAPHAHDAALGMGGLAGLNEMAFEVFIKGHAETQKIAHAVACFARHAKCDRFIDNAATGGERIRGVFFGCVAFRHRCRNAALRPCGRGAFTEWGRGENRDGARAEF